MSIQKNLPTYAGIFGDVDFKEGDENRSVYSPAAYLTDLLQMLDDEFDDSVDIDSRRSDIKSIPLDAENTTTLIPYLDIVNEVLEKKINDDPQQVYQQLEQALYPFNSPFSLNNERTKTHLKYLGLRADQLYRLFADQLDYLRVARDYLGLSESEYEVLKDPANDEAELMQIASAYGYQGDNFIGDMSKVSTFIDSTGLSPSAIRELLYQNLYVAPSDHSKVENGRDLFYVNTHSTSRGYVGLSEDETTLQWYSSDEDQNPTDVPLFWFDRAQRFVRFAQKIGLSFTELDHLLRHCCLQNNIARINDQSLPIIAQVRYLQTTLEQPLDAIIATISSISFAGRGNEALPQDQFNRIFNLDCARVDKKYLHLPAVMGETPVQYSDTQYHTYEAIDYFADLFSDANDAIRKRLQHTLGFSETDLRNITQRLKLANSANDSLYLEQQQLWPLLNVLYRVHSLSSALDIPFMGLFTLFDLLEQDAFVGRYDPHNQFIYRAPSTQKCFDILLGNNTSDRLWLLESLTSLNQWMKQFGFSPELLWYIANGTARTDSEEKAQQQQHLQLFNGLLSAVKAEALSPESFSEGLDDERAAHFAYSLQKQHCQSKMDDGKNAVASHHLVHYQANHNQDLAEQFIAQLQHVRPTEFIGLSLQEKLTDKLRHNLMNKGFIDGSGAIVMRTLPALDEFLLESDFSELSERVYYAFHEIFLQQSAGQDLSPADVELQLFKSDLDNLGLETKQVRELFDNLIFLGYIDEQGYVSQVEKFSGSDGESIALNCGLNALAPALHQHLQSQLEKFSASRVKITESMFESLMLKPVALAELFDNLQANGYIDQHHNLTNKLALLDETPETIKLALQFYPQRTAILAALQSAIANDRDMYLQVDMQILSKIADQNVSQWIHRDLQNGYLQGNQLSEYAVEFFQQEDNQNRFKLRPYFDTSKNAIIFEHLAKLLKYSQRYQFKAGSLRALDFDDQEAASAIGQLMDRKILNAQGHLNVSQLDYFSVAENAADFSLPGYEDYEREVFFLLYELAGAVKTTVAAIDNAMKIRSDSQQTSVLQHLQSALGIDQKTIAMLSKALFKAEHVHIAWLQPLYETAMGLEQLNELPTDMHYLQTVKRIIQLALLVKKLQLDHYELALALQDQSLVEKFPEDIVLPEGITSIDCLLRGEEFIYLFKDDQYWLYNAHDYTMIDKKQLAPGDPLLHLQKQDEALQLRLREDPIRQLFDKENLQRVDAAFIDRYGTWCVISDSFHYVLERDAREGHSDTWDKRDNHFGQTQNDFEKLEMIDATYVDEQQRLYLLANDKYVRYTDTNQTHVDQGYPKTISEHWNEENLPLQLPASFEHGLGPMFDGTDGHSYAFLGNTFVSSENGQQRNVASQWGHSRYDFGHAEQIDAAMDSNGQTLIFAGDRVVKYSCSLEMANLQPVEGYPKPIHEEFPSIPGEFAAGLDAALHGLDDKVYLFKDDECVHIDPQSGAITEAQTNTLWGKIDNSITDNGTVDAAFVGLDGYTYLFSGEQYVRYSSGDYQEVDDGFPRNIADDWQGLTHVTAAFVLGKHTYLFGTHMESGPVYVRYTAVHRQEDDYLETDQPDPTERKIETVLSKRPDVDEIEIFPAPIDAEFWSLPASLTASREDFKVDAVMNGPNGKVYLFAGDVCIEHDHASRWWSEPKVFSEQWDRVPAGLGQLNAALYGKDGNTYLFYPGQFLRFGDPELLKLDRGYPRATKKVWGKVRNNIERTGKVDAAVVVESRWREQGHDKLLHDRVQMHTYLFSGDQFFRYSGNQYQSVEPGYPRSIKRLIEEPRFRSLKPDFLKDGTGPDAAFADQRQVYLFKGRSFCATVGDEDNYLQYIDPAFAQVSAVTQEDGVTYLARSENGTQSWHQLNHIEDKTPQLSPATPRIVQQAKPSLSADISAVLHGTDGNRYVFAGHQFYDAQLERSFNIEEIWGRSRNAIYEDESIDAAFVGKDGITYVFSGDHFVQYATHQYIGERTSYPPRLIQDKWAGLQNVALAYVWKEDTFIFEKPDQNGQFRYLRYSPAGDGAMDYRQPDAGYPKQAGEDFWQIPEALQREGFDQFDTIFVQNENLLFISDQKFIRFNLDDETWSYPQPLELLYPGIPFNKTNFRDLQSGFVGGDGSVYFFNQDSYVHFNPEENRWSEVADIRDDWGLQENILAQGVQASYVDAQGITYLFSGDKYVRYSSSDFRFIDQGYPKDITTYLRQEPGFNFLTEHVQDYFDGLEHVQHRPYFTGILRHGFSVSLFSQDSVWVGSPVKYAQYSIEGLGKIDNPFTEGASVDAAFVQPGTDRTYLFSDEKYIRYTGKDYRYIDEGYPKLIAEGLAEDLGIADLAEHYRDGLDAALYHPDLGTVLFSERQYLTIKSPNGENSNIADGQVSEGFAEQQEGNINDRWGRIYNAFMEDEVNSVDGAYIDDATGALHMFKGRQHIRYSDTAALFELNPYREARYVDEEYPQFIHQSWPHMPADIVREYGAEAVFKFEGKVHFHHSGQFVRYQLDLSDQYEQHPTQTLAYRWGRWSDYLLSDIHQLSRFKDLNQRYSGGDISLSALVSGSDGVVREPYMHFADIFGFEKEQLRWLKQRNGFLPSKVNRLEREFDVELSLRLYDTLSTCQRIRVDVAPLYHKVWHPLYSNTPNLAAAAEASYAQLVAVDCNNNYQTLVRQIRDEVNTLKRDALVPYVIANDPEVNTARELYQKLLIDIQMASCADTSRIKEATAAIQLYLHRYFVNLEDIDLDASDQQATREAQKEQWQWLKNYRVWEANRKVFLYPENYIRPELRDSKTPAFGALEESLSQGELTENTVESAYFNYLDAYTEVSELEISGGYVFDDQASGSADKTLVLFGRTKTNPKRYFYRFGTFIGGDSNAATWKPWIELNIQIEADRVQPVYAFNRVFVFWAVIEHSIKDNGQTQIVESGNTYSASANNNSQYEVKIYYSFYNLNKRWSQPQLMNTFGQLSHSQAIAHADLFVEHSSKLTQNATDHQYDNIYVSTQFYFRSSPHATHYRAFNLTPELYSQTAAVQTIVNRGRALFNELFNEGDISPQNVVKLNSLENSMDGPWFAYNHKGCGFMVKPEPEALPSNTQLTPLSSNDINIPTGVTAAVQVGDGGEVYYFTNGTYSSRSSTEEIDVATRWGRRDNELFRDGIVDSALVGDDATYLTRGPNVYEYRGDSYQKLAVDPYPIHQLDPRVPPSWQSIDAAFTAPNGHRFYFNNTNGAVLNSGTGEVNSYPMHFGLAGEGLIDEIGSAVVYNGALHDVSRNGYRRFLPNGRVIEETDGRRWTNTGELVSGLLGAKQRFPGSRRRVTGLMSIGGGVLIRDSHSSMIFVKDGTYRLNYHPEPLNNGHDYWNTGLSYQQGDRHYCMTFVFSSSSDPFGGSHDKVTVRAWVKEGDDGKYQPYRFSNNSEELIIRERPICAFTSADGTYLILTTNTGSSDLSRKYRLFYNHLNPEEVATQFDAKHNEGIISDLGRGLFFSDSSLSLNQVDAAFVGTGSVGAQNALYLFSGEEYFRYSLDEGNQYSGKSDTGYPKPILGNDEGFPDDWTHINAAFTGVNNTHYFFDNDQSRYIGIRAEEDSPDLLSEVMPSPGAWGVMPDTALMTHKTVDAAYTKGGNLYLLAKDEYYRYTLGGDNLDQISEFVDVGYPKTLPNNISDIDAAFAIDDFTYLFHGQNYYRLDSSSADPAQLGSPSTVSGNWGNIPSELRFHGMDAGFNANIDGEQRVYLVRDDGYIVYDMVNGPMLYDINVVNYDIVRLTSSTAEQLNQILFSGGVKTLLKLSTQQIDESPTISFNRATPENISMRPERFSETPTNSHLDYNSANGLYYWEVFFHAPFLIAQTLNNDQKFEYAKTWYEFIYDPTEVSDYWKFLPFLAADPQALMLSIRSDLDAFADVYGNAAALQPSRDALDALALALAPYQAIFLGQINKATFEQNQNRRLSEIEDAAQWPEFALLQTHIVELATLANQESHADSDKALLVRWQKEMLEILEVVKKLDFRVDLMSNHAAQLKLYLNDPFDPHAIAALRVIAYRKAIIMRYVDNLLDWGDLLFRQYTRESINEARMLYILAHDLLGEKPRNMGRVVLEPTQAYKDFLHYTGDETENYDFLIDMENQIPADVETAQQSLSFAASQSDTVLRPYFYLKENELFTEYWQRVEDRLDKIRNCLNIDGIAQPLPLFQPPINPMALVNAAASGAGLAGAGMVGGVATVPDYRFDVLLGKSRELVGKLKGFSDALLSALEKQDAETMSLLQNDQEASVLDMSTQMKKAQIDEAMATRKNLVETQQRAKDQEKHYGNLISTGYLKEEEVQIQMMTAAAVLHGVVALGRIVSGLSYVVPQFTAGPFSFGVTSGGKNVGDMVSEFGQAVQSISEGLSMGGEVAGIVAQFKRSAEDWELQKKVAVSEIKQLEHQIEAHDARTAMLKQELKVHEKEIDNKAAIRQFMNDKFTNKELYNWISGKISGLYFQTYKMAHDYAKQAEQAFVFEKGLQADKVNYVRGAYWDSQRKGLLAGGALELDLDRMDKAFMENDSRSMEITKNVSLIENDPMALLQLKTKGHCQFRLSEDMFDYDFPGHYRRQLVSISLSFEIGEGQSVNATLTQLSSHLVMEPDIKAVKHLLDPSNETTTNVRSNWRANQQVALSHVDQYTENNGMFQLNFGDARYLPFEGTGAVSHWRLELNGKKGDYNPADLMDVTVKVRYRAMQGGNRFANEVKGVLKPYHATAFFDMAYNFPDQWNALTQGDEGEVEFAFSRDQFPNISSSRIIGLFVRYEYQDGESGPIFTINDQLDAPNNTYLQQTNLGVGQQGALWKFSLKGDPAGLKNAELVLVYKAKV
ncbi:hemopexin repeat-containing protein [Aliikangiella coralliicola]|uniref:Hemopexin n=1 Tax=Aliikangiella coralliicola TaxID=2592383 RepID=A0A545U903_9GAMM|nr:hemopexin repeat-containing protein [Aliikangiella coralliicola]TQV85945.1 hypothetical protein FLL46_18680 [Aliikangiella coralliicola]